MSTSPDDAQRELEQRALKNVRGLVDRMERDETSERRSQRRLLALILVIAMVGAGAIAYVLHDRSVQTRPVVIDAVKLPPIRPGPPR